MSWPMVALKDCCRVVSGGTPKTDIPEYWEGENYWVTPKDLSSLNSIYIRETAQRITDWGLKNSSAEILPVGSVLFSSRAPIGHIAITKVPMCTNQGFKSFVPGKKVDAVYLYFCLKYYTPELQALGNGATFKEVSKRVVEEYKILLPPLEIQKHIARVLEKADQLGKQAQQMESELNQLAQALFLEMFGDYRKHPNDCFVPLSDVADVVSGVAKGSNLKGKKTRVVPYLRVANVQDGFLDLSEIKEIEATERDIEKYVLQPGAILMTEGGDYDKLGRGAMWSGEVEECIHQNHIFRVRLSEAYELKFFEYYLRSTMAKTYFLRCAKKTTNLASINMSQLKALPTPKEDKKKQERFVSALGAIEKQIQMSRTNGEHLEEAFQALMQRAFKGELTAPGNMAA